MKRRRVKITGIGPVTPAGIGKEDFWRGILEPVSRVRPFTGLGEEYGPMVAAYIDRLQIDDYLPREAIPKGSARHTVFAIVGAMLAIGDASLTLEEIRGMHSAVVTGSTLFDFGGIGKAIDGVARHGVRAANPRVVYTTNSASIGGAINEALGLHADAMTLQSSCASGLDAIGHAATLVASGIADIALCGGSDAPLHRFPLLELRAAGLTPTTDEMPGRLARPFDLWRTTGVISEGACMFVLEPEESPRPGYSFVRGYATANDPPNELCGGFIASGRRALGDARLHVSEVEAINAWGPGHRLIDPAEAGALNAVLGAAAKSIPCVSIKGAIGTPLSAAGPMQVAAAALGQRFGKIAPTVNWEFPDPSCPLKLSSRVREVEHRITLLNAQGLAGVNSTMLLERC